MRLEQLNTYNRSFLEEERQMLVSRRCFGGFSQVEGSPLG